MANFNQIQRDEQSIMALKPGDRVWVGTDIDNVQRVTATQVIIAGLRRRFWKGVNGKPAGKPADGYSRWLKRVATPAECAEWDRQRQAEADKRNAAENARIVHYDLLAELAAGLNCSARVRDAQFGERGTFDVILEGLTEAQVRKLTITLG